MFERFTERARQVVVLAQEEARELQHPYIGTEHLLLGLLREEEGLAACVLDSIGVELSAVRGQVERIVGRGEAVAPSGQIPFTPRAKKVLELALREALSLRHNYIGTEHILLGLARESEGVAARILLELGADADATREAVGRALGGPLLPAPPGRERGRRWRRPLGWQYQVVQAGDDLEAQLNALGGEGWELVLRTDDGRLVLKRPAS
jgi:ATP-dependent Clp protease ATP-binding subunit ClpC